MSKKLLSIVIASSLIGGVVGSAVAARFASASVWDDVLNFLRGAPTSTAPVAPALPRPERQATLYQPAVDYEQAIVQAVEEAAPSVVSIVISKDLPIIEQCPYDPFGDVPPQFRDFFGGGFEFLQPCQKGTKKQEVGGGSGFLISSDGLILTNRHVVTDAAAEYTVLTNDGKKYTAKVLARDPVQDLAVIKVAMSGAPAAKLGNSDAVKLGQTAIAIGNSLGEFRNTVSVGVISGLARDITASGQGIGSETIQGVIQTDAAINPGNSGGPLLNLRGEVIGINTAIAAGAQNIGFAIPINRAKRAIDSVRQTGKIKTPYLGIRYLMVTDEFAKRQQLPVAYGALIRGTEDGPGVIPGSPAEKAGLKAEDIILEVNGKKVEGSATIGSVVQERSIGDTLTLKVQRGKDTLTLTVKLGERPTSE